jgi:hypothetical protein
MSYTFDGVELDDIYDDTEESTQSSGQRTASGKLRVDMLSQPPRQWALKSRPIPKIRKDEIINYWRGIWCGPGQFHHDEWDDGESIEAIINITSHRLYNAPGYYELSITVTEV